MDVCPTPVLTDDHLDLLISAAATWGLIASPTRAAFTTSSPRERELLEATASQAGMLLRRQNLAGLQWLADRGRSRLVDRPLLTAGDYQHRPVEHLVPVEVIKAAHAAEASCHSSPSWSTSTARRLLQGTMTAATHRIAGYDTAPGCGPGPSVDEDGRSASASPRRAAPPSLDWNGLILRLDSSGGTTPRSSSSPQLRR